jgi:hypothetical protein
MKISKITLALALALAGIGAAQAAQFSAGGGLVAGRIDGLTFQQTPYGLNGGAGARTGAYTGLQASAGAAFGPVLLGLNAMKSTGGVQVDDLSASAGYALQATPSLVITPGAQWGVQHVNGQSYTRVAATLGAGYSIAQDWTLLGSFAVGRTHGTRSGQMLARGWGDYRAGQLAVAYSPARVGTFTLAATEQVTQTASLPGMGDLDMRNKAVSLTYSRAF